MDKPTTSRRSGGLPTGIEIRKGKLGDRIQVTFTWLGQRRRELLNIPATPANIKYAANLRSSVQYAIERSQFDYATFFPNSKFAKNNAPAIKVRHTIGGLIDSYIDTARRSKSLSPSTIASYVRWANARLKPQWGDRYEVQTVELRSWIADLVAELTNKSVRNCVGLLSAVLSRAAADSVIPSNPLAPIKMKSVLPRKKRADDDDVDPFNDDEIFDILSAFKTPEERALWQFAFSSGLRTGEMIAIKDIHADTVGNTITVIDNVVSAEVGTVEKDTKTGKVRSIPMLPGAREAVLTMRSLNKNKTEYLFFNPATGMRWMDDQQLRKGSWIPALLRAKVRYRNPYQTRHTFASKLLEEGEQENLVAVLLGHATVEMVRRHYGRYIKQTGGIKLRGDYSKFVANSWHSDAGKSALIRCSGKKKAG